MSRYKYILLDLDETIFDFKMGEKLAIRDICQNLNLNNADVIYDIYKVENQKCWKALERKEITKQELFQIRWIETFRLAGITIPCKPEELNKAYMHALANYGIYLPGAKQFMESLHELSDIGVYIITNGTSYTAHNRMKVSGLNDLIDGTFVSDNLGVNKPDKLYFDKVLSSLNATPEECLVIGDSLTSDIKGANNKKIPCCLYTHEGDFPIGFESYKINFKSKSYDEILEFIKKE